MPEKAMPPDCRGIVCMLRKKACRSPRWIWKSCYISGNREEERFEGLLWVDLQRELTPPVNETGGAEDYVIIQAALETETLLLSAVRGMATPGCRATI